MKTVADILNAKSCGDIFEIGSKKDITNQYRELARIYHPDVCIDPEADLIMAKINSLYQEALNYQRTGTWKSSNTVTFHTTDGKISTLKYLKKFDFELGTEYTSNSAVVYVLKGNRERFFENAKKEIELSSSGSEHSVISSEFSKYVPKLKHSFKSTDGSFVIVLDKSKDIVPLRLILEHYKGSIPHTHVAWMISRLCNLVCFFAHTGVAHNGLTIENLYVDPAMHSIYVFGGWWYARPIGKRLIGVPKFVYDVMPVKEKGEKVSSTRTDIEAIKRTAKVLLGKETAPEPMMEFLDSGSGNNAIDEFCKWTTALEKSYGQRRFIRMDIAIDELYK